MGTLVIRFTAVTFPLVVPSTNRFRRRPDRRFIPGRELQNESILERRGLAGLLVHSPMPKGLTADEVSQAATHTGLLDGLLLTQSLLQQGAGPTSSPQLVGTISSSPSSVDVVPAAQQADDDIYYPIFVIDSTLSDPYGVYYTQLKGPAYDYNYGDVSLPDGNSLYSSSYTLPAPQDGSGTTSDTWVYEDSLYGGDPPYPAPIRIEDSEDLSIYCGSSCGNYYDIIDYWQGPSTVDTPPYTQYFDLMNYDGTTKTIDGPYTGPVHEYGTFSIGTRPGGTNDTWQFGFTADGLSVQASMYAATITYSTPSGTQIASADNFPNGYSLSVSFDYFATSASYNEVQLYSYHQLESPTKVTQPGWSASDNFIFTYNDYVVSN